MNTPALAGKPGARVPEGLLGKARRAGLDGAGLERLAIQRGCDYYSQGELPMEPAVTTDQLSNEELASALLHPELRDFPRAVRLGAAMLAAEGNDPATIARLAQVERSAAIVRYVAEAGSRFEPHNEFWRELLRLLPAAEVPASVALPHPTRFVEMTGIDRGQVGTRTRWIRPRAQIAA